MASIDLLLDAHATLAKSPALGARRGHAVLVDIRAPALFRLDPATLENRRWELPEDIGAFALLDDGKSALVALRSGLFALSLATGSLELVAEAPWRPAALPVQRGRLRRGGAVLGRLHA